jgi:hypothetical protein
LLVGSMIRASTSARNTSSEPAVPSKASDVGAAQRFPQMLGTRGDDL